MDERINPVDCMAQLLAEMTKRALEAERQRDAAREDSEQWYNNYRVKQREIEELKEMLDEKQNELKELKDDIQNYIEIIKAEQVKRSGENGIK